MEEYGEVLYSFVPSNDQLDYMQFLFFELSACKRILEEIIICKNPKYNYSTDNLKFFMEEYKAADAKFTLAMSNLLKTYAPNYTSNEYRYNFDFDQKIVNIYYNDENKDKNQKGGVCGCGSCKN